MKLRRRGLCRSYEARSRSWPLPEKRVFWPVCPLRRRESRLCAACVVGLDIKRDLQWPKPQPQWPIARPPAWSAEAGLSALCLMAISTKGLQAQGRPSIASQRGAWSMRDRQGSTVNSLQQELPPGSGSLVRLDHCRPLSEFKPSRDLSATRATSETGYVCTEPQVPHTVPACYACGECVLGCLAVVRLCWAHLLQGTWK